MGSITSERGKENAKREVFEELKDETNLEEVSHLTLKW